VLEPHSDGAALVRRAEDDEAGKEFEEAVPAGADGAIEGGRDDDELEGAPTPLGGGLAAQGRARCRASSLPSPPATALLPRGAARLLPGSSTEFQARAARFSLRRHEEDPTHEHDDGNSFASGHMAERWQRRQLCSRAQAPRFSLGRASSPRRHGRRPLRGRTASPPSASSTTRPTTPATARPGSMPAASSLATARATLARKMETGAAHPAARRFGSLQLPHFCVTTKGEPKIHHPFTTSIGEVSNGYGINFFTHFSIWGVGWR
jgi:hypothetical protein